MPVAAVASRSRARRWLQNLSLALATFLLCGLVLELVLRLAGDGHLEIYQPDPKLYWRLQPNQDCFTKVGHQPVHINAQGTRGPEFSVTKPAGTFRILSLGDSRTFGWGLADGETYSRRLEALLNQNIQPPTTEQPLTPAFSPSDGEREGRHQALGGASRVEVINAGVNAWSYSQMAVYLREFGLRYQPDVVVLAEANLWTQFSERSDPEFVRQFMRRVRLKNFLRRFALYHYVIEVQLQDFYQRHRTKFIPVDPQQDPLFQAQQQTDPDAVFRGAIADVCRTARSNRVEPLLVFLPTLDDLQSTNLSRGLRAKQAVSAELGVPLVDLTRDLAAEGKALYLEADPVHLDARGNEIVARRLFETITNRSSP
jgi:lysophospholipase L1-like esterase